MALNKTQLAASIKIAFNKANTSNNIDEIANDLASAIDTYIKTGNAVGVDSRGDSHNLNIV